METGLSPLLRVNLHHLPRQVPCPPYMLPFPGEPPSLRCPSPPYPDRLRPVSLPLWSDPFPLCPGGCQAVRLLPPPPWPSASHLALGVFPTLRPKLTHLDLPGLGDDGETQEGEADQPHVVHTELCQGRHHRTGEVAPETLGGRRRRRLGPSTLPLHPQVGRLHGSVPNLSRYLESRDPSGPRGLPPPDYAYLQRSFWALAQKGECELEGRRGAGGGAGGGGRGGGRESDAGPAPAVHSSLSSVLAALTAERDLLRGLHQGSEPSRLGVSRGPGGWWEERPEDGRRAQAWGGHRPGPGRGLVEAGPA